MESKYFDIIELFIQYNTDSCCEYVTGDVNIYLYGCTSVLVSKHICLCVCVFVVCEVLKIIVPAKIHIMCQMSLKFMTFWKKEEGLHKIGGWNPLPTTTFISKSKKFVKKTLKLVTVPKSVN